MEKDLENLEERRTSILKITEKIKTLSQESEGKTLKRKHTESELLLIKKELEEKFKLEGEVEKAVLSIANKREFLNALKRNFSELSFDAKLISSYSEERFQNTLIEIKNKKSLIEKLNSQLIDIQSKLSAVEKEKASFLAQKERIFRIEICPTCLQNVPDFHKHNILNNVETKLSSMKTESSSLNSVLLEANSSMYKTKDELEVLEKETLLKVRTR